MLVYDSHQGERAPGSNHHGQFGTSTAVDHFVCLTQATSDPELRSQMGEIAEWATAAGVWVLGEVDTDSGAGLREVFERAGA